MKGMTSKDGAITGNAQLVRSHDMHHGKSMKAKMEPEGQSGEETGQDHSEIDNVVAEHGPAHTHTITDNQDGTFSSHTEHADGHVHEKHGHGSLEHAHEHGEHAMGEDSAKEEVMEEHEEKPMGMGKVSHSGAGGY